LGKRACTGEKGVMSLIVLTFTVGILNLGLGYALAVRWGRGPSTLRQAWQGLGAARHSTTDPEDDLEIQVDELLDEFAETSLEDLLDSDADEDMDIEPFDEAYDDDVASLSAPEGPDSWNLDEKYVETSILKLNIAMMKSGARATEIDTRLRSVRGNSDHDTIQSCLAELTLDCETYLDELSETAERFSERIGELGELSALGEEIEMANLEQSAQIETTINNLNTMDFESDLEAANERLLEEIKNLRVARHKLRDNQDVAFVVIARYEDRMGTVEPQLYNDSLTGLRNRIGLETTLWEWWRQRRHQSRPMSAALFDIDGLSAVNEQYGSLCGDRIIQQIGRFIEGFVSTGDLVGRYAGQQFVVVQVDVGPRAALKNFEIIRQSIHKTTYLQDDLPIEMTLTGGVTEVMQEDSDVGLLERLEETFRAARSSGNNRSFVLDPGEMDAEPKLVESPNFGVEPTDVEL
jgi:diguanylate cyclase (GGDEF)-like protein